MIQTLHCQNGDHYYDRLAVRGRQATSCVDHGGSGVPVKSYRTGSRTGEAAFATTGGGIKARLGTNYGIPPRTVPVRKVPGSDEGAVFTEDSDAVDFDLSLFDTFPLDGIEVKAGYRPETSVREQRALLVAAFNRSPKQASIDRHPSARVAVATKPAQPKRLSAAEWKATTAKRAAGRAVDASRSPVAMHPPKTESEKATEHSGEFWCEVGEHWAPRKSNRGRVPKVCDEHKATPAFQHEHAREQRDNAEARGTAVADSLEAALRERGLHLSQNGDRFQLERRDGRKWTPIGVTADNWGVKHWTKNDANAHQLKLRHVRWVPLESRES